MESKSKMKVAIVHKVKGQKKFKTVEFTGTSAVEIGMQYVYNNQPIDVVAVRFEVDPKVTNEMIKGFGWKAKTIV